jgi:transcriptional regulator with XRE-family HTH domain
MDKKMLSKKTTDGTNMGQMIQKILKERKMPVSDFAKALHCSRTNVYGIFKRQLIGMEMLKQIADILELDVTDFMVSKKRKSNKYVIVMEVNDNNLERLLKRHNLTYMKWKVK